MRPIVLAAGLLAAASALAATYQVRSVPVRVAPFYEYSEHRDQKPRVAVRSGFDRELASLDVRDITKVRDAVRAKPELVSPVTMMVLAIRLYDVGLRDESVFWFHAARARMATAAAALDTDFKEITRINSTAQAFSLRAGPTINGYALCEPAKEAKLRREALDWVEANPYSTIFIETIPAKPGGRQENIAASLREQRAEAARDAAALASPEGLAKLAQSRRETKADEMYCWR